MKKLYATLISLFLLSPCFCQIQWQKCLGGSNGDRAKSMIQTTGDGFMILGTAQSGDGNITLNHGGADAWVVRLHADGILQWQKTYGGSADETGEKICATNDGGYILACSTRSNDGDVSGNHGQNDIWIVKLNNTGSFEWQKCYGGSLSEGVADIRQTNDGGYIVVGFTLSNDGDVLGWHGGEDCWVIKLSITGAIEWQKCYGGSGIDHGEMIRQTTDGGYILAAASDSYDGDVTQNFGSYDYWILKLSATGAIEWQKCFGSIGYDYPTAILQAKDGGFIVAGHSTSPNITVGAIIGMPDFWVLKLSANGALLWQRAFGGSYYEASPDIQEVNDGGYIIAGYSGSNDGIVKGAHGNTDALLVKLSSSGNVQWGQCFGGTGQDDVRAVLQTTDGGYAFAGYTNSVDGDIKGNHGVEDMWVVKLGAETAVDDITGNYAISLSPNPASDIIHVAGIKQPTIRVYNISGQLVREDAQVNDISVSGFPLGMYFIQVFNEEGYLVFRDKIIKN